MGKSAPPSSRVEAAAIWSRTTERVRDELSPSSFEMWFSAVRALGVEDEVLLLGAPNDYVRKWLAANYLGLIRRIVREETDGDLTVRIATDPDAPPTGAPVPNQAERPEGEFVAQPDPLAERYTFETFVVGESNRFPHAMAMAVAEAPPASTYNPLFIWGGVGLGKTHLLYATANHMTRLNRGLRAKYVTSETFVTEFIRAVREGNGYRFQQQYRDVDVLLVDDVQFLAGKEETQTEFFHTFNALHGAGHQIVMSSDRAPQELSGLTERLRSRFRMGLVADVQPPDLETRIAILQAKAMRDGIDVPDDVIHFIAERFESNIRELEGALLRVAAFASLSHLPVDLSLAARGLEDLMPSSTEIPADVVLAETARYFGLGREDLVSRSRSRPLTAARHVAMYLLKQLAGLSSIKIGELFDRDHSTALYGIQKIERQMRAREPTYRQVADLTKTIKDYARGNR
ncbi:MAG: chromosomal replication initiator protein DnaA [Candidatus Methylomirabilales bacterium]